MKHIYKPVNTRGIILGIFLWCMLILPSSGVDQNNISPASNVIDWNPYTVLPPWEPPLNHSSINRDTTYQMSRILNTTYSGSVGLAGFAVGKELYITNGPFSITYTVHPNVTSPRDVWVKLTLFDPWQQVIAEGGYNRGFPNQETQEMKIYRTGGYYMSIEGEFARVDYVIKTGDWAPVAVITPVMERDTGEEEGLV